MCFDFYIFEIYIIEIDINKCLDGGEVIVSGDIYEFCIKSVKHANQRNNVGWATDHLTASFKFTALVYIITENGTKLII